MVMRSHALKQRADTWSSGDRYYRQCRYYRYALQQHAGWVGEHMVQRKP